jgi:hypothetical protein
MWPFKPKETPKPALPKLIYKSGEAFFRSQCQYGFTDIVEGQGIVAIVLDAREEFGTEVAVKVQPNGCQLATIRIASPDGGFRSFAETASPNGDRLKPGDLVVWVPMTHMQKLADTAGDHRQGWIGLIVAKIAPEADPANNELSLLCRY